MQGSEADQGPSLPNQKMPGSKRCTRPPRVLWRAMYTSLVLRPSVRITASTTNHAEAQPA